MAKLYFKYGAMGSSKTATALITKYYEERGMKVWLIKPSADSRDGQFTLKSRIGLSSECEAIGPETDIRALYHARQKVDVIIVDECQFMTMAQIDQLRELVDREDLPLGPGGRPPRPPPDLPLRAPGDAPREPRRGRLGGDRGRSGAARRQRQLHCHVP